MYDALHPQRVAQVDLVKGAGGEPPATLVQYLYTERGELATVIDRTGQARRHFAYRHALMTEHAVPGGLRCQYEWRGTGADARVVKHWTDDGEAYTFDYDLARRETTVTDQVERVYHWVWSDDKQPTAYTDPEGHVWRYAWDANRQLVSMTDPLGAVTCCEYDESGRLTAAINALDQIEKTAWHPTLDLPVAETDAAGNRWSYVYDVKGNLLVVTDPEGYATEQFYDERGLPHTIRDARGGYKHMAWSLRAQMVAYTDCSGKRTDLDYDAQGALARVTDAMGNATVYHTDAQGRLSEIVRADGSTEAFRYDEFGRLQASIDTASRETQYQRNARGQLVRRINALGRSVQFTYDRAHRLERLINENGESYHFVYDRNNNVIKEIQLDGMVKRVDHDARGMTIAITSADGDSDAITLHMQRDALGRLIVRQARGGKTSYRYDQVGQLIQAQQYIESGGIRTIHDDLRFTYSKRGELLSEAGHMGKSVHQYDELGNRCTTVLPDGRKINSLFYGSGHLHQLNVDGEVISDMERDDLHREISRSQGSLETRFGYDRLSRKTSEKTGKPLEHDPVMRKEWMYDPSGEMTFKKHSAHGSTQFIYDSLGQIHRTVHDTQREVFNWDAAANLVDSTYVGGYVRHNRMLVFEDKRFEYDVHGRLETKRIGSHTEQSFSYDGEHRLREVSIVRKGVQQRISFDYDALGRRIRKHDAFGKTLFLWDCLRLSQERRGNNVTSYLYEPDSYVPLARIDSQMLDQPSKHQDNSRNFDAAATTQSFYYFHNDVSGIPEELFSNYGELAWQANYKIWGNTVTEQWLITPPQAFLDQFEQPVQQNLRFQGQYLDRETGLHYNTFRFYDPDIGRFISPDPVGLQGGINLHRYAPNPVAWADPLGLEPIPLDAPGYTVYGLFHVGEQKPYYVGITANDPDIREVQHSQPRPGYDIGDRRLNPDIGDTLRPLESHTVTYSEARGYEQAYREFYGTKPDGARGLRPGNVQEPLNINRTGARADSHKLNYQRKIGQLTPGCS